MRATVCLPAISIICAADIEPNHDVEIINPDHVIAHLTAGGKLEMEIRVEKGRGYQPAVADQVSFHGAALPPMTVVPGGQMGAPSANAVASGDGDATPSMAQAVAARSKPPNYTSVMAAELIELARKDDRIVAITAGMPTGTGPGIARP